MHNKRLQYTVRVAEPNPVLANLMLEQFGGPDGELAAAMRYFTQGLGEDDPGRKDMLLDIATEELSHLEVIGSIVAMLNKGAKARARPKARWRRPSCTCSLNQGGNSHTQAILYGGGPALTNSAGVPWTAAYVDTRGDPTCDLRSNIAAESARQDRLRAADQRHRRSRHQGRARLPDDARGRAPEVVREGALRDRGQLPAGQAARHATSSPTSTSTRRRAKATWRVRGTPASSGSATRARRAGARRRRRHGERQARQGRQEGRRGAGQARPSPIPRATRSPGPISAPGPARAGRLRSEA